MSDMSRGAALSPAERKRRQRAKEKEEGFTEITVRVPLDRVDEVRDFVASLPAPAPKALPGQQTMFDGEFAEPAQADTDALAALRDEFAARRGAASEAARDLDVSRQHVSAILAGRSYCSEDMLRRLQGWLAERTD